MPTMMKEFDEESQDDNDSTAIELVRNISLIYFVIFPDENPGMLPNVIGKGIDIDDEQYSPELPEKEFQEIYHTVEKLEGKSEASQNRELEKLQKQYIDSPQGLLSIYLAWTGILEKEPPGIGELIEEKHPDTVAYIYYKSNQLALNGNPDKARELLGESMLIQERFPNREGFTSDEWVFYLMAWLSYLTAIDDLATAITFAGFLALEIEGEEDEIPILSEPLEVFFEKIQEKLAGVDKSLFLDNLKAQMDRR